MDTEMNKGIVQDTVHETITKLGVKCNQVLIKIFALSLRQ